MRQVTRKGLITVAAAGGVLATFSGGTAFADTGAHAATGNSSGVLSGNAVQAPVSVPVNVCGNTVSVLGTLNSSSGSCADSGSARTSGSARGSEGIGSGNQVQAPVNVPVNVCGNGISALSTNTSASGCGDSEATPPGDEPDNPGPDNPGTDDPDPDNPCDDSCPDNPGDDNPGSENPGGGSDDSDVAPASDVRTQSEPAAGELAHTGAGDMIGVAAPLSAGLLIGGFVLYRRASRLARR
ncbi:chaplin [Streptomyces winkii]|uniref:chaplin n=1 Tax=Streptomyces winkii TaxID=3051178 RepID=UPI0028D49B93|nr:chaplin [Streptomyces sp. DSM 40971]